MKIQNNTAITFQSGLTKQMSQDIRQIRPELVSAELKKYGIQTDFQNNKAISWCVLKCINLIQTLNNQYGLNLGLPKGIFVEDFSKLDMKSPGCTFGFCNLFPAQLYKNNPAIVPEKTLFFNEIIGKNAEEIDLFADYVAEAGDQPDSYFLTPILHEFMHAIHENHLINKLGGNNLLDKLNSLNHKNFIKKYFYLLYQNICQYATVSPLEAVACDLSQRILNCSDKTTVTPVKNPIKHSPYNSSIIPMTKKIDRTLKRFWNGNFD